MPFIEAFRQFQFNVGESNFCNIHVSLVPEVWLLVSNMCGCVLCALLIMQNDCFVWSTDAICCCYGDVVFEFLQLKHRIMCRQFVIIMTE